MFKKVLIGAVAVALTSGVAHAGENKFTKEEGTGLARRVRRPARSSAARSARMSG